MALFILQTIQDRTTGNGLGALTREQLLEKGWKVDFVEKIPPPSDQPAQSPRGLPLYLYKLVISR